MQAARGTLVLALCWAAGFSVAALAAAPGKSVMVMPLVAKAGVSPDVADQVTQVLTTELRNSRVFSRVVSGQDLESAVGMEQKRQLLNCSSESCMAEIANTMNTELLVTGNLGRLGRSVLLSISLVDARRGTALASFSSKVKDGEDDALLDVLPDAVRQLLSGAGMAGGAPAVKPAAPQDPVVAGPAPSTPSSTSVETQAPAAGRGRMVMPVVFGVVSAVTSVVLGVGALAAGVVAAYVWQSMFVGLVPLPVAGVAPEARWAVVAGAGVMAVGGVVVGAVALVVAVAAVLWGVLAA